MRRKRIIKKKTFVVIAFIIAAQVIALCCVSVVHATESRGFVNAKTVGKQSYNIADDGDYTGWLDKKIDAVSHNRLCWLYKLMTAAGYDVGSDKTGGIGILEQAGEYGIIEDFSRDDLSLPLTRGFVAATLVKALKYPELTVGYISDIGDDEGYMSTAAYFGYFLPDVNNRIYPDKAVTDDEYRSLMNELDRYRLFKGRRILSFGDSIMYGTGNNGEGISDMLAVKYGMTCTDYAVPGATLGVCADRGHIPDQIRTAYSQKQFADIILINGGTNDMNHTALGAKSSGFDMSGTSENDFTGAFERSLWMFRSCWSDVPVIYIRAHNMQFGDDAKERLYGDRAMEVAAKWNVVTVDLYNNSGMNTEDPSVCGRYTYLNPNTEYTCDSIHPNALGYAKFYLPPVAGAMDDIFGEEK